MNDDKWLDVNQLAEYLNVANITIYRMIKKGKIKAYRIGNQYRFNIDEINEKIGNGIKIGSYNDIK